MVCPVTQGDHKEEIENAKTIFVTNMQRNRTLGS